MPLVLRVILGAILCALLGYLIDTYVPLQPLAHIAAIVLYAIALLGIIYAGWLLVFGPGPRLP